MHIFCKRARRDTHDENSANNFKIVKASRIMKNATFIVCDIALPPPTGKWSRCTLYSTTLGHASITTTQLYTKVTNPQLKNIKSPL